MQAKLDPQHAEYDRPHFQFRLRQVVGATRVGRGGIGLVGGLVGLLVGTLLKIESSSSLVGGKKSSSVGL
jgi:hypothetical protein